MAPTGQRVKRTKRTQRQAKKLGSRPVFPIFRFRWDLGTGGKLGCFGHVLARRRGGSATGLGSGNVARAKRVQARPGPSLGRIARLGREHRRKAWVETAATMGFEQETQPRRPVPVSSSARQHRPGSAAGVDGGRGAPSFASIAWLASPIVAETGQNRLVLQKRSKRARKWRLVMATGHLFIFGPFPF